MRVIDDAQKRLLLGNLGEQAQDREADQELIRCRPGAEPERDVKRVALGLRQAIREVEEWSTLLDEQVRGRIVSETRGNPLALLELPRGLTPAQLAGGLGLVAAGAL